MLCVMRLHITMTSTIAAVPRSPMASEVPTSTLNESLTKACATCSAVFTTSVDRLTVTSFCARYSFEYRSMARSMSPASAAPITALRRAPSSSQAFEKRSRRSGSALNSDLTTFSSFMRCSVRSLDGHQRFLFRRVVFCVKQLLDVRRHLLDREAKRHGAFRNHVRPVVELFGHGGVRVDAVERHCDRKGEQGDDDAVGYHQDAAYADVARFHAHTLVAFACLR